MQIACEVTHCGTQFTLRLLDPLILLRLRWDIEHALALSCLAILHGVTLGVYPWLGELGLDK